MGKVHDNPWTRHPHAARAIAWAGAVVAGAVFLTIRADLARTGPDDVPRGIAATPIWVVIGAMAVAVPVTLIAANAIVAYARNHRRAFTTLNPEEQRRRREAGDLLRGTTAGSAPATESVPHGTDGPTRQRRGLQPRAVVALGLATAVLSTLAVMSFSGPTAPAYWCPTAGEPDRWCDAWIGKVTSHVQAEHRSAHPPNAVVAPFASQLTDAPTAPVETSSGADTGDCVYVGRAGDRHASLDQRPWVVISTADCPDGAELLGVPA